MKCFLFIPEDVLEDQICKIICRTLKNQSRAKVYFFHPFRIGEFRKQGFPEIQSNLPSPRLPSCFQTIYKWYQMVRVFYRRRKFRETIIIVGRKTQLLFWIYFLTSKKPIFVWVTKHLNQTPSWFDYLILGFFSQTLITNDQSVNHDFRQKNRASYFFGNILADLVQPVEFVFIHGKKPILSFFPERDHFEFDVQLILRLFPDFAEKMKGYYLLVIPSDRNFLQQLNSIAFQLGWHLVKSLEGEILEGYLRKDPYYMNLTLFQSETMVQSDLIFSLDDTFSIQAVGFYKKVIPIDREHPQEIFSYVHNPIRVQEMNRSLQNRFGKSGAKEKIGAYLLWGVVEDKKYSRNNRSPNMNNAS